MSYALYESIKKFDKHTQMVEKTHAPYKGIFVKKMSNIENSSRFTIQSIMISILFKS